MSVGQVDVAEAVIRGSNPRPERLTLRELRERRELSLRALEVVTGISRGTLSQIETGGRVPSLEQLQTLGAFYGVEAWQFVVLAVAEVRA